MGDEPTLESLALSQFGGAYEGRRVVVTGHTGFKGSWLSMWLTEIGAKVSGIALSPETSPNHWDLLGLDVADHRVDIRDAERVRAIIEDAAPELVFHLAAQPLVRRSYRDPLETWSTNVIGTANVLEACRKTEGVQAIVVVTSDKCYENKEWPWGYRETDSLGGHDPYSASKAATEIVAASYRNSFFSAPSAPKLATARAGNVIGGGDWSEDRLIPDLVRAQARNKPLKVRFPESTRPWQHVLESASAYLVLGQHLLQGGADYAEAWNFGPDLQSNSTVAAVLDNMRLDWPDLDWVHVPQSHPHEAAQLSLDTAKARTKLGWKPVWNFRETLQHTANWYREFHAAGIVSSKLQLASYIADAGAGGAIWA